MGRPNKPKGIFCIEGLWDDNLKNKSSVKPILDLLYKCDGVPYIYHCVATPDELKFFLKKWGQKKYNKDYPILYLSMHGTPANIKPSYKYNVSLDEVGLLLENKCKNKLIFIGSCAVFQSNKKYLKNFLEKTNALLICGYAEYVEWMESTAFELLFLNILQQNKLNGRSLRFLISKINDLIKKFPELKFRMLDKNIITQTKI